MNKVSQESTKDEMVVASSSTDQDIDTPRFTRRETLFTMSGVLLVMLLASLDQTIVGTAMPRIITDLQGFDRYAWVTTAYLLTSTVMVPIYGKLSDIFGRKPIFLIGVVLFLIGSALSGASQTMNQLIAFRAFQGLGAAALMPIAIAVIGDLFTPRERGKWQGLTGGVFGLSSILGPTVGGWITDHSTWRWVFYVNLPIGIAALLVLIFLMPPLRSKNTGKVSIDYLGAALLILGTVPLLLGFTWAGTQYSWLSWQIISIFGGAVVFLTLFFLYEARLERQNAQPIIAPSLFTNRIFTVSVLITMITSMGLFGTVLFLPLYAQVQMDCVCWYGNRYCRIVTAATPQCELSLYGPDHCDDRVRPWPWFQYVNLHGYRAECTPNKDWRGNIRADLLPLNWCHRCGSSYGLNLNFNLCNCFSQCHSGSSQSGHSCEDAQCL